MFENVIRRKLEGLRLRRVSSEQYLIFGLVAMIGLALIFMMAISEEQADAHCPVLYAHTGVDASDAAKPVILQWMKKHSRMSEQVLAKIYKTAMDNANADLVLAICLVESNFNPRVESEKGAMGLMGIMPSVWLQELRMHGIVRERDDLYAITSNMNSGIYVLRRYLARTNDLKEALSRYAGGDPTYAVRVLRMRGEIKQVRRSADQLRFEVRSNEA